MKTIAIIGALEKEVREVASAVDGAVTTQEAGLTVLAGTYHGARLVATTRAWAQSTPQPPHSTLSAPIIEPSSSRASQAALTPCCTSAIS